MAANTAARATMSAAGLSHVRAFISGPYDDLVPGAEQGEVEYEITAVRGSATELPALPACRSDCLRQPGERRLVRSSRTGPAPLQRAQISHIGTAAIPTGIRLTAEQNDGSARVLSDACITQRDGGQGTDAPGSRTHVPGPGRQPEPRPLGEPRAGARPPGRPRSPGTPAGRSPSSSLGGIKASPPGSCFAPCPRSPRSPTRSESIRESSQAGSPTTKCSHGRRPESSADLSTEQLTIVCRRCRAMTGSAVHCAARRVR